MLTISVQKPSLILVQSTDSPIREHLEKGIWERQKHTLSSYAKDFDVFYYTCDVENMQHIMPQGVWHKTFKSASQKGFLKHFAYYYFLVVSAFEWSSKTNVVIRIIGVNLPVIPFLKSISKKKFVISYQFDWAMGVKKDYKGIKPMVAGFVQRIVINAADHLICTTQWLADIARERYNKNTIAIIPNYVNLNVFKPEFPKKKQIAFAGRLHWSKGIDTLIEAFTLFCQVNYGYKLIVMGVGEDEQKLKKMAMNNPGIIFTGGIANSMVAQYFNESEIFVLPTVNMEGHPKALIEAMAAGCKCITSDVPGNNHVLHESSSSDLLFKSGDANDLMNKLIYATQMSSKNQYQYAIDNYVDIKCFQKELAVLKENIS